MDYDKVSLDSKEKFLFYFSTLAMSMMLGWLFYDNFLITIPIWIILQPLRQNYEELLREKRKNILLLQFKDLLYSLSSLVSVGRSIGQALEESIDFWKGTYSEEDYIITELKNMTRRMKESRESDISVLKDFAERSNLKDIDDFVIVCKTCKEMGGDLAKAMTKTSDIIGEKIALERELKTMVSQKRFEGRIIALAPFIMVLGIKIASPEYLRPMTTTQEGRIVTTIALILLLYSWSLIERMNKIDF